MLALVASSTKGNSLDQGTSAEDVEDLPDELARVQEVARQALALGLEVERALLGGVIVKVKERNVAEVKIRQVGQSIVGQLKVLKAGEQGARVGRDVLSGRVNVVVVGSWKGRLAMVYSFYFEVNTEE